MPTIEIRQREICAKFGAEFVVAPAHLKVGISENVRDGIIPLNGLRHSPEGGTTGWYIWAGEQFSESDDFFKPLHVEHMSEWCPQAQIYLGLAPGWRFLLADDYVDVWFDSKLLEAST